MAGSFSRRLMVVLWFGLFSGAVHGELSSLYGPYQQLLEEYLREKTLENNGLISAFDYEAALADDDTLERLRAQRERLARFDLSDLEGREESTAFWINAYNFFMLNQILTERPGGELVDSVWDYGGRYNPFTDNVFQRKKFEIAGRKYSLDGIEKGILLGDEYADRGWKDARVHFAVNCAAVGCPPLRRSLYTAQNLEQLLATNTRRAFSTARHLQIDGKTMRVTELFKWYGEDFTESAGSRKAFIRQWVDSSTAERIESTSEVTFINYDWDLNRPENFSELQ